MRIEHIPKQWNPETSDGLMSSKENDPIITQSAGLALRPHTGDGKKMKKRLGFFLPLFQ